MSTQPAAPTAKVSMILIVWGRSPSVPDSGVSFDRGSNEMTVDEPVHCRGTAVDVCPRRMQKSFGMFGAEWPGMAVSVEQGADGTRDGLVPY